MHVTKVNNGGTFGSGTSAVGAMPSGTVGRLLIGLISFRASVTGVSVGRGWTILSTQSQGGFVSVFFWKIATGDVNDQPNFSWTTTASWECVFWEFSGQRATSPLGAMQFAHGNSNSATASGVTTTQTLSTVIAFIQGNATIFTITSPGSPWTTISNSSGSGDGFDNNLSAQDVDTPGASGSAAFGFTSSISWSIAIMELLSDGGAPFKPPHTSVSLVW